MAEGRTRICGKSEESIFLRSRGSSPYYVHMSEVICSRDIEHTLAMSSVFLNSPLTNVTLPSSLNSVQRNFSSFVFFAVLLRPSVGPFTSSKKLGRGGRSFSGRSATALRRPKILFNNGRASVDACRDVGCLKLLSLGTQGQSLFSDGGGGRLAGPSLLREGLGLSGLSREG